MRIAIIGGGWYGCHLALSLSKASHEVRLFEKSNRLFSGASGYNQNRLHLGFHYPRNYSTRSQSAEGFKWFNSHYSKFLRTVPNNYYALDNKLSSLDYKTYEQIMTSQGLKFRKIKKPIIGLKNIEECILVGEMLIRNDLAAEYFSSRLASNISLNSEINLNDSAVRKQLCSQYDLVVDCTWLAGYENPQLKVYYEPCIYFRYKSLKNTRFALTVMDGKFISLYPCKNDIYTLTSVEFTPIDQVSTYKEAEAIIASKIGEEFIKIRREKFEEATLYYYPNFLNDFKYIGYEFAIKTKIASGSEFRGTLVMKDGNFISVFSGKIDTIHIAEQQILEFINDESYAYWR